MNISTTIPARAWGWIFWAAGAAAISQSALASETLARSKACLACHQVGRKVVGPAYQDIAARYADKADARAILAQKIRNGSSGEWGPVPMPANPRVSAEEAGQLAEWILGLKKP